MGTSREQIAGYPLIERLSEGPRTTVWRARDPDTDETVVLKQLSDPHPSSRDMLHFRREFNVGTSLKGDGFIDYLELKSEGKQLVLVEEDFGAESVAQTLNKRRFDLDEFFRLAVNIAEIIGQMHDQEVVHRDINPSNLVWNPETEEIKLIDFGLAIRYEQLRVSSPSEATMGTLAYISPEQTGRTSRPVDYRTDYYSLGVTLYEMLVGTRPFRSDTPAELLHAHLALRPSPAHHLRRDVPKMVSEILGKLMSKSAERRYQSARGLIDDLCRCSDEYRATGTVSEFELGGSDRQTTLRVSRRMFGRNQELRQLKEAVRAAGAGARCLTLVAGEAGVGKSRLVEQLHTDIVGETARVGAGKFEPPRGGEPYGGIAEAFGRLVAQLMGQPQQALEQWRKDLRDTLGDDEALVVQVVPGLQELLGQSPRGPSLEPEEARHRFHRAFSRFAALFRRSGVPLVVVLDDLQWADDASLHLLEVLLTDQRLHHLLVVGTYRSDDVDSDHPLSQLENRLQSRGQQVETISLEELNRRAVCSLVADSLNSDEEQVEPLGRLVYTKTSGNPYFVGQFLEKLYRDQLLWFDADANQWRYDEAVVAGLPVTDNVVDMLQTHLDQLPEPTRRLVMDAALFGASFQLQQLAVAADTPVHDCFEQLRPALNAGIIVGRTDFELLEPEDVRSPVVIRELFFAHDRVRDAVMQRVEQQGVARRRYRIGQRLWKLLKKQERPTDRLLFATARNLNAGIDLIDDPAGRERILQLNVWAAERAMKMQAVSDAAEYLRHTEELLDDDLWDEHPTLARTALLLHARAELAEGQLKAVDRLVARADRRIDDAVELVDFRCLTIRRLTLEARFDEALELGRHTLDSIGIELSIDDPATAVEAMFQRVQQRFGDRPVGVITETSRGEDQRAAAALRLLAVLQPPAGLTNFDLLLLVGLKGVDLTFDTGVRAESVVGLAMYGAALCHRHRPHRGKEAGRVAMDLARHFDHQAILSHVAFIFGAMILPWSRPLAESLPVLEEGVQAGIRGDNRLFAGFNRCLKLLYRFYLGRNLSEVARETNATRRFCEQLDHVTGVDLTKAVEMVVRNLMGKTESVDQFCTADNESEQQVLNQWRDHGTRSPVAVFQIARAQTELIEGMAKRASQRLEAIEGQLGALVGTFDTGRHPFYLAVALAMLLQEHGEDSARRRRLDGLRAQLVEYAETSPHNFEPRLALVDAEIARVDGDVVSTIRLYDDAIRRAQQQDLVQLEAFASKRAGTFWMGIDKTDLAGVYLHDAHDSFEFWGAKRPARQLERQWSDYFLQVEPPDRFADTTSSGDVVDVESVLRASEMIAGHLELEALLPVLTEVTMENAGAQRGSFIVVDDDRLCVAAQGDIDVGSQRVEPQVSIEHWDDGPASIVHYVHRTGRPLVVSRAHRDPRFRADPYLQQHRPRSLCCIPAEEHGRIRGILYLENNLVEDAFGPERIRVLRVLADHVAIALNKARLYAELREKKERFRQLAENIAEVFWLMDWPDFNITYLSPAYETIWGRPMPSFPVDISEFMETIVPEDRDRVMEAMQRDMESGDFDEAYRIVRPSGTQRWVHVQGFPITDSAGEVHRIAGVARDVTREHELSEMKDEFISVVSHELRTPLTPITGIFSMLHREYADELPEEVHQMTELGLRNSRRLLKLIDDLLDIQRLSMEQIDFHLELFDVRDLVEEALELNAAIGNARDIRFEFETTSQPLLVRGDQDRLVQIVTNLLSNAVKFSDPGDTVEVKVQPVEDAARISVTDHGPGIPPEVRHKIFDKFTQADPSMTRRHGGVGLGLAIARSLVDRFGGRIYFETEPKRGTTFHVELPLAQEDPEELPGGDRSSGRPPGE